jgi:hypothetical protein
MSSRRTGGVVGRRDESSEDGGVVGGRNETSAGAAGVPKWVLAVGSPAVALPHDGKHEYSAVQSTSP